MFKTIGSRIFWLLLIAVFTIAGVSWYLLSELRSAKESLKTVYHQSVEPLEYLKTVSDVYQIDVMGLVPKVERGEIEPLLGQQMVVAAREKAAAAWHSYLATDKMATDKVSELWLKEQTLRQELRTPVQHVNGVILGLSAVLATEDLGAVHDYAIERLRPAVAPVAEKLTALSDLQIAFAKQEKDRVDREFDRQSRLAVTIAGGGLVLLLAFGTWLGRSARRSLRIINTSLAKLASSEADLSQRLPESADEIGDLARSFNQLMSRLEGLVKQAQRSGIQVTSGTTRLAAGSNQLEATVNQQVSSTNQVVANAKEISATSKELVIAMGEVSQLAHQTAWTAGEGQQGLQEMEKTMESMEGASKTISLKLAGINEKAENISSIVTTINKVADQTNLLSLNAAIEAEKAGEYGQGFAVVAREIRRLADQSAVATLDIEKMVKDMKGAVASGVMSTDQFADQVRTAVATVADVSRRFGEIIEQVQALTPRFESVSSSVEAQSKGALQISEAMMQLGEASRQTAAMIGESNRAIEELSEAANGLQREFSRFSTSAVVDH